MPVTAADVPNLVSLALRLRKETYNCAVWDHHGTELVFARELVGTNFRVALELVIAHACDPEAKGPGAIKRQFKPEPGEPIEARRLRTKENTCSDCGHWLETCICHYDDLPSYGETA